MVVGMDRIVVLLKGKWYCDTVWVSEGVMGELYEGVMRGLCEWLNEGGVGELWGEL